MHVFEEMSHKEIAEKLEISEGTSKSNLSKARQNLRKNVAILLGREEIRQNEVMSQYLQYDREMDMAV